MTLAEQIADLIETHNAIIKLEIRNELEQEYLKKRGDILNELLSKIPTIEEAAEAQPNYSWQPAAYMHAVAFIVDCLKDQNKVWRKKA